MSTPLPWGYPPRAPVKSAPWSVHDYNYQAKEYTDPILLTKSKTSHNGWLVDPHEITTELKRELVIRTRRDFDGPKRLDLGSDNRPLNPVGRTGISGRGSLSKWGPNVLSQPIITRVRPRTKQLEILLRRPPKDASRFGLPGGPIESMKELVPKQLLNELATVEGVSQPGTLAAEGSAPSVASKVASEMAKLLKGSAKEIFAGYYDDPRNTDNAWLESICVHYHLDDSTTTNLLAFESTAALALSWVLVQDAQEVFRALGLQERRLIVQALRRSTGEVFKVALGSIKLQGGLLNPGDPSVLFETDVAVGEGTYGEVYKALHKATGQTVAIKMTEIRSNHNEMRTLEQELMILRSLSECSFVVSYFGSWLHAKHNRVWTVLEYCDCGSLSDVMFLGESILDESECQAVMASLVGACMYLHARNIVHRDIKAANLLLSSRGALRLADFGVAAVLTPSKPFRTTAIGAPYWMAPEVVQEVEYGTKADMWSCGIVAIELAEQRPPHHELHPMRALFVIPFKPSPKLTSPEAWSQDMHECVRMCLEKTPSSRCSAVELSRHAWLRDYLDPAQGAAKRTAVLRKLAERAVDVIRDYRGETTATTVSTSPALADGARKSLFVNSRPISQIFDSRNDRAFSFSRPDSVRSKPRAGTADVVARVQSTRMASLNDVLMYLEQPPLTPEEASGGSSSKMQKKIAEKFVSGIMEMPAF